MNLVNCGLSIEGKMMKALLIGRVAQNEDLFDGQTVKTRNMYDLLKQIDEIDEVLLVDTFNYMRRLATLFIDLIKSMKKCDVIILCVSINGRKLFFPLLYYLNHIFKKEVYHSLIGGRLKNNIDTHPSWKKYVKSFKANLVECREIVHDLEKIGIYNGVYLPNFKKLPVVKAEEITPYIQERIKFCTFSRVQKNKGIEEAILAIVSINEKKRGKVLLDIYGPIDEEFKDLFYDLINKYSQYVNYKGCVDANQSVDIIKNYYALIFATRYYNEGIPGTIIDALSAGIPVIARRWHYCDEMIDNHVTGYVYDFDEPDKLEDTIITSLENHGNHLKMRMACIEKAHEYSVENAKDILSKCLITELAP